MILFELIALGIMRCPLVSWVEAVGTSLFVLFGIQLAGVVLLTGIKGSRSTVIVWTSTLTWSVMFCWWAWVDTASSPFIIHEIHTLDPAQSMIEIHHFYIESISTFIVMFVWLLSFPFVQRYARARSR
jgi:hypothetical protein